MAARTGDRLLRARTLGIRLLLMIALVVVFGMLEGSSVDAQTQDGTIVIIKDTQPDDPQDFTFGVSPTVAGAPFSLDDDPGDVTLSNTATLTVTAGTYSVSEGSVFGFTTAVSCVDPSGGTFASSGSASIGLAAGEIVTCTFTNVAGTAVRIVKQLNGDPPAAPFEFTVTPEVPGCTLPDGNTASITITTASGTGETLVRADESFGGTPCTYTVTETPIAGYDVFPASGAVTGVTIADPFGFPEAYFTNTKLEPITINKTVVGPAPTTDWEFTITPKVPNCTSTTATIAAAGGSTIAYVLAVNDGPPCTYTVTETTKTGWTPSPDPATYTGVSPNATVDFTNTAQGSITIVKDTVPDGPQDFMFTTTGGLSPASFTLDDDTDPPLSNTQTYTGLTSGTYTVTETANLAYNTTVLCTGDNDATTTTNSATIELDPGEDVTCTFTNTAQGSITIVKDTVPDGPQDFMFTTTGGLSPTSFTLDDDTDPPLSNTQTFTDVAAGSYTVTETANPGYTTTVSCVGDNDSTTTTTSATIELDPGEDVTCTFTNTALATIEITKATVPAGRTGFGFTAPGLSPTGFNLDDGQTQTFTNVASGSYTITEPTVPGYDTQFSCSDSTMNSSFTSNSLTAVVEPGDVISCTVTNTAWASIEITKLEAPDTGRSFDFTSPGLSPSAFSLASGASQLFSNVATGSYTITEPTVAGYDTQFSCSDSTMDSSFTSNSLTAVVQPGDVISCTVTNTGIGSITIVKDTDPNSPQDFDFTAPGLSPSSFTLDDDSTGPISNTQTFTSVPAGSYTITETANPGYTTTVSCVGDNDSTTTTTSATIELDAGEDVTCTFTNTALATIEITKVEVPDTGRSFGFTTSGGLSTDATGFSLTNAQTETISVDTPGTYTITEPAVAGYDTQFACSDSTMNSSFTSNTLTAVVEPGDVISCTVTNSGIGSITIVKDTQPDSPRDFEFTATGGLTPASFTLDDDAIGPNSNTQTFSGVPAGSYTITEAAAPGYTTTLTCTGDNDSSISGTAATIELDAGENVTCTFSNVDQRGSITITKVSDPAGGSGFGFTAPGLTPTAFTLDDGQSQAFTDVVPGTYTVTEPPVAGYATTISCDDAASTTPSTAAGGVATVNLDREDVTCTVTNTAVATIEITKVTVPAGGTGFDFESPGLSPSAFTLDDGQTQTFTDVTAGSYTITEPAVAGYETAFECSDTTMNSSFTANSLTAVVQPGDVISCTVTNTGIGTITIVKDTQPDSPADFDFTATGGLTPATFTLDDDATGPNSNTQTYTAVPAGTYTITETATPGYTTTLTCTGDNDSSTSGTTATIELDPGENVTCTYTNTALGTIEITKVTNPAGRTGFDFEASGLTPTSFTLDHGQTQTYTNVAPGSYTITETAKPGYTTVIACDDASSATPSTTTGRGATIEVDPGELVRCTFINTALATIEITKVATPDAAATFDFTTGGGLATDAGGFSLAAGATYTFTDVAAGTYTITEPTVAGYETAFECSDTTMNSSFTANSLAAVVDPGDTISCTVTNTGIGTITIVKDTQPDSPQDFDFTTTGGLTPATFTLDDDATGPNSNTQTYTAVPAGTYTITETATPGYTTTLTCTGDNDSSTSGTTATIELDPGENVTCTYTNTALGTLIVIKDTVPNDPQDFAFTIPELGNISFSLDDDDDPTLPNTATFTDIAAGTYSVAETPASGYATVVTCADPDGGTTTTGTTATVDLDAGETITCTYTNNLVVGTIMVVQDTVPNDPQDFTFTTTGGLTPTRFVLDDDADPTNPNTRTFNGAATAPLTVRAISSEFQVVSAAVVPGAYTITQLPQPGWTTTLQCVDPDGGTVTVSEASGVRAEIDLDPGEAITCTWTSTRTPPVPDFGDVITIIVPEPEPEPPTVPVTPITPPPLTPPPLAHTGADSHWGAQLAFALLGSGFALLGAHRRRRRTD